MEVYILDSLNRPTSVVDMFESLIWTERFSSPGDFELHLISNFANRKRFVPGARLAMNDSRRVMTVETVEDISDEEGRQSLKVTGVSLEDILSKRLAMADLTDLTTDPQWYLEGFPKDIAEQMFHDICVTGILDAGDIIAGITEGSIYPADTIDPPTDDIVYVVEPQDLLSAEKTLCDTYEMGFRLVRDHDTHGLYFDIYTGNDRTTGQTENDAVIFSPDLENIQSTNRLTSRAMYKNVAYVVSPVGHEIVFPDDVDPSVAGFDRRVLFVKAEDITDPDGPTATLLMIQRGKQELAKAMKLTALDGQLTALNPFRYDTDYFLGDLVELRDDDGAINYMRVTEQIFVSDGEGDRNYPTLSARTLVVPGSWNSVSPDVAWDDIPPGEDWDTGEV